MLMSLKRVRNLEGFRKCVYHPLVRGKKYVLRTSYHTTNLALLLCVSTSLGMTAV